MFPDSSATSLFGMVSVYWISLFNCKVGSKGPNDAAAPKLCSEAKLCSEGRAFASLVRSFFTPCALNSSTVSVLGINSKLGAPVYCVDCMDGSAWP